MGEDTFITKLRWNLPWLVRYPFVRARALLEATAFEHKHIVITVADHFEPGWSSGGVLDHRTQMKRLDAYREMAREIGNSVSDADGTKFRHTNFYPAEQYHPDILDVLAEMQEEGLGEVEVHLHHGVDRPDTAENLERQLVEFRDTIAERHRCLSRWHAGGAPMYAFVHGNLALANSCGGKYCGVDDEMAILRDTGCYADFTLPSAPDRTQVAMINMIYEYGGDPKQAVPHAVGKRFSVNGTEPQLPLIFTGPLIFDLSRVRPRIEDGSLTAALGSGIGRLKRWASANITVEGRSDVIFIKLYCHGFFDHDQQACIGEDAKRLFGEMVEGAARTGKQTIHFASAREAFNMAVAISEGFTGDPHLYRDHHLQTIMSEGKGA